MGIMCPSAAGGGLALRLCGRSLTLPANFRKETWYGRGRFRARLIVPSQSGVAPARSGIATAFQKRSAGGK